MLTATVSWAVLFREVFAGDTLSHETLSESAKVVLFLSVLEMESVWLGGLVEPSTAVNVNAGGLVVNARHSTAGPRQKNVAMAQTVASDGAAE